MLMGRMGFLGAVLFGLLLAGCSSDEPASVVEDAEPLAMFVRLESESPLFVTDEKDLQLLLDNLDEQLASGGLSLQTGRPLHRLLKQLQVHFREKTTGEAGLREQALAFWFMRGNLPVFQLELADGQRFATVLQQAQETSGERWDQAEYQGVRFYRSKGPETEIVWLVRGSRFLASWFPLGQEPLALKRLLDDSEPLSVAAQERAWKQLPPEYRQKAYATVSGWLDYQRMMDDLLQREDGLARNWRRILEIPEEARSPVCQEALGQWLALFPGVVFSQRDDREGNRRVDLLFQLKPQVAERLRRLASAFMQPMQQRVLLQMQFAVHMQRLLEELQGFLQQDAPRQRACEWLAPARQSLDRLERQLERKPPPALVRQLSGLGILLDAVSEELTPDTIRAMAWVQMENPAALLNLAGMFDPKLAASQWPADGKARSLETAMASRAQFQQPLWLAVNDHALGLAVGEDIATSLERVLAARVETGHTLFRIRQDLQRLFALMRQQARVMRAMRMRPDAVEHLDRYARHMDEMELRLIAHEQGLLMQLELTAP